VEIPRLHPDTLEEVKQKVDIVDIISERVVLRKRGRNFTGLCPFHDEKTGSFNVNPNDQLYYCFGCGAGGDAVKFLMELNKQSFSEVVFDLARRYQVPIKTLEPQQKQELQRQISVREQLYEILATAANFYEYALRESQGEIALKYLKHDRNLSEETIQQWNLGYAPAGWETLYCYLVERKRYPIQLVELAGLIQKRKTGEGYYDRYRDRVTIPICDAQGRIIGFGTRTLGNEQPKYLNSPETPLFDKGKTLFALDKARNSISKEDCAVVVEGYFDAIALHAVGITNVVASLGTALSQNQVTQLLRYSESKRIIFNFDADNAGVKATQRAIGEISSLVYSGQVQLKILNLPDGKDADEFLKNEILDEETKPNVEKYRDLITNAPLWLNWQIDRLVSECDLKQSDRVQQVAQSMVKLLNQLQDPNQRNHYLGYCAQLLSQGNANLIGINAANLKAQLRNPKPVSKSSTSKEVKSETSNRNKINIVISPETEFLETTEALLLRIYINCPQHRQEIVELLEEKDLIFSLPHYRLLWQKIIDIEQTSIEGYDNGNLLLSLIDKYGIDASEQIEKIKHVIYLNEKTQADTIDARGKIKQAIASLEKIVLQKHRLYCTKQIEQLKPTTPEDLKRMQFYYQECQKIDRQIKELEQLRLSQ
jgi:DNA primase